MSRDPKKIKSRKITKKSRRLYDPVSLREQLLCRSIKFSVFFCFFCFFCYNNKRCTHTKTTFFIDSFNVVNEVVV
jgi:hypothetical protein